MILGKRSRELKQVNYGPVKKEKQIKTRKTRHKATPADRAFLLNLQETSNSQPEKKSTDTQMQQLADMNDPIPDAKQARVNFVVGMFSEDENSVRFDLFPDRD